MRELPSIPRSQLKNPRECGCTFARQKRRRIWREVVKEGTARKADEDVGIEKRMFNAMEE